MAFLARTSIVFALTLAAFFNAQAMENQASQKKARAAYKMMIETLIDNTNRDDDKILKQWLSLTPEIQKTMINFIQSGKICNESLLELKKFKCAHALNIYFASQFKRYLQEAVQRKLSLADNNLLNNNSNLNDNDNDNENYAYQVLEKMFSEITIAKAKIIETLIDQVVGKGLELTAHDTRLSSQNPETNIFICRAKIQDVINYRTLIKNTVTHAMENFIKDEFIKTACSFLSDAPHAATLSNTVFKKMCKILKKLSQSITTNEFEACLKTMSQSKAPCLSKVFGTMILRPGDIFIDEDI